MPESQKNEMRILLAFLAMVGAAAMCGCQGLSPGQSNPELQPINHIIFMAQENRSFDHYFGNLNSYRQTNGLPQDVDGLPANASNPSYDGQGVVDAFHMISMCVENPSPSWNESHVDFNRTSPTSGTATLDGFVRAAATDAINGGFHDTAGVRAMGFYDSGDLPYYYFMASNFGTSDRWFSPVMSRTDPNRMYLLAGTSAGHVYGLPPGSSPLPNKTIFELLEENHISWKIYITDFAPGPITFLSTFTFMNAHPEKIVPVSEYLTDVANGTLPQVAMIEPAYVSGRDEHPAIDPDQPSGSVQSGSNYVASLINSLMNSPSWTDSVFILTFDEFGGFFDHVAPQPTASPDGVPPLDLLPNDLCAVGNGAGGATCDFTYTGFRVPLIVVSPFSKKNFVSHSVADYTAMLRLIESRFNLPSLTERDAAQMDMSDFFDFASVPWRTPPTPPTQPTNGPCYLDHLP
jgi:phospholipase C